MTCATCVRRVEQGLKGLKGGVGAWCHYLEL
ncbi:MAG: hypothetical protein KKI12_04615 [Proteobacteria bacterium]|nr:hypothetical protein [Pseudomonadota bacterium]MBU4287438.1 hypothetical protein [Pseudomonadota bacterium]MBU4413912.1 hypothetical protein [Pseudomonadota bacterium]